MIEDPQTSRIAIVGGGISGLAAAFRVRELNAAASITLFEAGPRLGGVLETERRDGLLIEHSADNFITNVPWGLDLCRRLGMEAELLTTDETRRRAFIVHRGRLEKTPEGFLLMSPSQLWPMLTTPLLSLGGKLRLLAEWFIPGRRGGQDESLASFVRRRFGNEVFERLVQPLVGGIYTADPEKLSMAATMPRFLEMERNQGGLLRATLKTGRNRNSNAENHSSGARYGLFVAPRGGMASLIERLAASLPTDCVQLNTAVTGVERGADGGWLLNLVESRKFEVGSRNSEAAAPRSPADLQPPASSLRPRFDSLIIATPAYRAAELLHDVDPALATDLASIPYASTSIVTLVYRRADIGHPLDGFGLVVPAREGRQILAASFASNKYAGRAPDDQVLIRVFIGGAMQPTLADLPDERLSAIAATELAELLDIHAEPLERKVIRWPRSMPQYHVGHDELVARIEARVAELPDLVLAGNAYHGVGVPNCIHSGEQAAEKIAITKSWA